MRRSLGLALYLGFAQYLRGLFRRRSRVTLLPQDAEPVSDRILWLHTGGVLRTSVHLETARRFLDGKPGWRCVVTADDPHVLADVEGLLDGTFDRAAVPDERFADIDAFLDHWHPELGLWCSDLFRPALICRTKARGIPLLAANIRMTRRTYRLWRYLHGLFSATLSKFDHILVQDRMSASRLRMLGIARDPIEITGPLRSEPTPLPHDENERRALSAAIGARPVWLAAMTHPDEEPCLLRVFQAVRRSYPGLLMVLLPDDPARGDDLAALAVQSGCNVIQRARGGRIGGRVDICIADVGQESGLWFRLAPVSFLGGSLVNAGGQNPFAAVALGSAVLHGPYVDHHAIAYATLERAGAAVRVEDEAQLIEALTETMLPARAAELATAAWEVGSAGAEVTDRVLEIMETLTKKNTDNSSGKGPH